MGFFDLPVKSGKIKAPILYPIQSTDLKNFRQKIVHNYLVFCIYKNSIDKHIKYK